MKAKAFARVRVLVEVGCDSAWGDNCTVGQVHTQATRDGLERLEKLFRESKAPGAFRIVGDPIIEQVLLVDEKE
jgi:hypothetical protein